MAAKKAYAQRSGRRSGGLESVFVQITLISSTLIDMNGMADFVEEAWLALEWPLMADRAKRSGSVSRLRAARRVCTDLLTAAVKLPTRGVASRRVIAESWR